MGILISSLLPIVSMSRKPVMEASALRTYTATNSTRNLISCTICTLSTSTPTPCSSVSVMSDSTDNPVLSSRDSESPTGLPLRSMTAGNMMLTPELPGTTPCTTSTPNGPPCNSRVSLVKSLTPFSGSETSNSERDSLPDFSTTRSPSLLGTDMEDTCSRTLNLRLRETRNSTLSLTPTSSPRSSSEWIPLPKKEELLSALSTRLLLSLPPRSSRWKTSNSPMSSSPSPSMSLISDVSGNTTVTTP